MVAVVVAVVAVCARVHARLRMPDDFNVAVVVVVVVVVVVLGAALTSERAIISVNRRQCTMFRYFMHMRANPTCEFWMTIETRCHAWHLVLYPIRRG